MAVEHGRCSSKEDSSVYSAGALGEGRSGIRFPGDGSGPFTLHREAEAGPLHGEHRGVSSTPNHRSPHPLPAHTPRAMTTPSAESARMERKRRGPDHKTPQKPAGSSSAPLVALGSKLTNSPARAAKDFLVPSTQGQGPGPPQQCESLPRSELRFSSVCPLYPLARVLCVAHGG